ncbi:MAG: response regulator [Alphaproteobacteria bacterium]|nr:response regulator [Alphaproteobacteria bacterium]
MSSAICRVLLIDDDEDDQLITRELLAEVETRRFRVNAASTFAVGMEMLAGDGADVVLVDYFVDSGNGLDFIRRAIADGFTQPMILLTGLGAPEIDLEATTAGAADYLEKGKLSSALLERSIRYAMRGAEIRQQLVEKTLLLQMMMDNAGTGIATFDRRRRMVAANDRFHAMLGLPATHESGPVMVPEEFGRVLGIDGAELPACVEIVEAGGRTLEARHNRTPDGGFVTVCFDMTDRKRAELALQEARDAAEEASRSKSQFLANMSHELRTPLNAIIGFSDLMRRGIGGTSANYQEYAESINAGGTHLLNIINDVLDIAKIEARRFRLVEEMCDLRGIAEACLRMMATQLRERQLTPVVDIQEDVPRVSADDRILRQILLNLLSNSAKFTEPGGSVGLKIAREEDGGILMAVHDTGIGIAERDLDRVLQPFGQVDAMLNRRHSGTGLGLPLAKSLTELHGGRLVVRSQLGRGTTVKVHLPAERVVRDAGTGVPPRANVA